MSMISRLVVIAFCTVLPAVANETTNTVMQCQSITNSGNRCKRKAAQNTPYCKQHSADKAPAKPVKQCRAILPDGSQCKSTPAENRRYCEDHLKSDKR